MTANVLVPLVIVVYLFVMDWRMALLSLVTLVAVSYTPLDVYKRQLKSTSIF